MLLIFLHDYSKHKGNLISIEEVACLRLIVGRSHNFRSNYPFPNKGLAILFCFSEIFCDLETEKKDIEERDVLDEYERRKRIKEDRERYEVSFRVYASYKS